MTEKRIKPRMHRRIPIKVGLRFEGDRAGAGEVVEMSEGGMSFAAGFTAEPGMQLTAVMHDENVSLRLAGTILHAREIDGRVVYGMRFEPLAASTLADLKAMLKRHRFNSFRAVAHR